MLLIPPTALLLAAMLWSFAGCRRTQVTVRELTAAGTMATPTESAVSAQPQTEAPVAAPETTPAPITAGTAGETTAAAQIPAEETTVEAKPAATAVPEAETVTLPIELPAANGTMEVSLDPQNTFIRRISESRGIDVSRLAAVYSIPPSGQNYVFEFVGAGDRSAASLRRVYLLTDDLQVKSVAASNAAEREHISLTENWFCMNVLIKGVIFPSVEGKMQ